MSDLPPPGPTGPDLPGPPPPPVAAGDAGPPDGAGRADGDAAVRDRLVALREQVGTVVVGQDATVSGLVTALLVRGHVLVEGVPGTAKTLLVKALAAALDLDTARVQCTPDLLPADITGQPVLGEDGRTTTFREGPVFTNLLLVDELNRTPPKTQSALLEAMQERQVTVEGRARPLPDPFLTIATQNPVEQEGTYPLPEAQLDRFLLRLVIGYPSREEEVEVLGRHDEGLDPNDLRHVEVVAGPADLAAGREAVARVRVAPEVRQYVVDLARATREQAAVDLGVSPRGATMLLHAAKAWAWLAARPYVTPDEVKAVARPALEHRLLLRPEAALEGTTARSVLDRVLATVPVPR